VPPGSNLVPLSFLEYINDLPLIFQAVNFVLCADDMNITVADKQEKALQDKITSVTQLCIRVWLRKNDLIANSEKRRAISFNSHQNRHSCRPHIMFNTNEKVYCSELKYFRTTYYGEFSLAYSDPFLMCIFE